MNKAETGHGPDEFDPTVPRLEMAVASFFNSVYTEFRQELLDALPPETLEEQRIWDPIPAGKLLMTIHDLLTSMAREHAQAMHSFEWLWYLRRLPSWVFARQSVTGPIYDWVIAQTLSGLSETPAAPISETHFTAFPLTDARVRQVCRMAALAIFISRVQRAYRRAAKGQSMMGQATGLPRPVTDPSAERYIELYDQRAGLDARSERLPGNLNLGPWAPESGNAPLLVTGIRSIDWQVVPGWNGPLQNGDMLHVLGRFGIEWVSLDALQAVVRQGGGTGEVWWHPALPALAHLCSAVSLHLFTDHPVAGHNLPKVGYVQIPRLELEDYIDKGIPIVHPQLVPIFGPNIPTSGAGVLSLLDQLELSILPTKLGPVIRNWGRHAIIDLFAASERLQMLSLIPSKINDQQLVKARADQFELDTQEVIDRTKWRPSSNSPARGLELKRGKEPFTDLDAVGELGDTLLLVDSKSYPFTYDLFAGHHKAVKNVQTRLDKAVQDWTDVILAIRQNPVFPQYDFSRYREVFGVVVTPHVIFSDRAKTTDAIRHSDSGALLRPASSIGELYRYLTT